MSDPDRVAAVWERLARVTDPELDEPVTELRFVTGVDIAPDGAVSIAFRLPTYWCAANFAFMMADDMRREVSALPWVTRVVPQLGEHMYADTINDGVQRGASFHEAFGDDAAGDLDALRRTFLVKAFQRRQEALLQHLRTAGVVAESLTAMTLAGLDRIDLDAAGERLRDRYLDRRHVAGPAPAEALAFVDAEGHALIAAELPMYLRALRRVGTNAEFNSALCSGLLAARFGEEPAAASAEPSLHDFIRDAARRDAAQETVA